MKEVNYYGNKKSLRCEYTRELVSDLKLFHNIDAQQELCRILSNEIIIIRKKKIEKLLKHIE